MGYITRMAASAAAVSLLAAAPTAHAASEGAISAEKLRRLDIMLMVSALRCRHGADGFQSEYDRFATAHLNELNAANQTLRSNLARRHGSKGAKRALDKLSVSMANTYGSGHPSLGCRELKKATGDLARDRSAGALLAAADKLLSDNGRVAM